jgi:hypothetical protein
MSGIAFITEEPRYHIVGGFYVTHTDIILSVIPIAFFAIVVGWYMLKNNEAPLFGITLMMLGAAAEVYAFLDRWGMIH